MVLHKIKLDEQLTWDVAAYRRSRRDIPSIAGAVRELLTRGVASWRAEYGHDQEPLPPVTIQIPEWMREKSNQEARACSSLAPVAADRGED